VKHNESKDPEYVLDNPTLRVGGDSVCRICGRRNDGCWKDNKPTNCSLKHIARFYYINKYTRGEMIKNMNPRTDGVKIDPSGLPQKVVFLLKQGS
jgi:hypothetical protein